MRAGSRAGAGGPGSEPDAGSDRAPWQVRRRAGGFHGGGGT